MGFFNEVRNTYGPGTATAMKRFSSNQCKLAALQNRRNFLIICRRQGIRPHHIMARTRDVHNVFQYRDAGTASRVQQFENRLGNRILNLEISITVKNIAFLNHTLEILESEIVGVLPNNVWLEYKRRMAIKWRRVFHTVKRSNIYIIYFFI